MHDTWKVVVAVYSGLSFATAALAADVTPEFIDCTPKTIFLCAADINACDSVPVVDVQGAYRIRLDLKKRVTETFEGAVKLSEAKIERIERQDDLLFLQGHEATRKDQRLPRSWIAIIDPGTGRLTISAATNGLGFVLNGNCSGGKGGEK